MGVTMTKPVEFRTLEQPQLSPALLAKIADTFSRKIGGNYSADDALAWWDWIWPNFEAYWLKRRYRNVGRAILSWAARIRDSDIRAALDAASFSENLALEREQEKLNEAADNIVGIDYFSKLGGGR
jgi:hypothetical protein